MPFQLKSDLIHRFWFLCLLILLLINSMIIVGFQLWFVYTIDGNAIESFGEDYADSIIIDHAEGQIVQSYLLRSPDGESCIVTFEKHPFAEKYRFVKGGSPLIPKEATTYEYNIIADSARVLLTVTDHESISRYTENELNFVLRFGKSARGGIRIPLVYVLYSVLLLAIEIAGYVLIEKLRK